MGGSRTVPTQPDSALLVPFPEVDRIVAAYRLRHDRFAPIGMPAHVTVHFPWLPAATVDPDALAAVRALAGSIEPFAVTFTELRWFAPSVLWLAPEPDHPLRELSERSAGRWPEHPLYDGQFAEVVPHLTIGERDAGGDPAALLRTERELARVLPLRTGATELWWLVRGTDGRWAPRSVFPFGAGAPRGRSAAID